MGQARPSASALLARWFMLIILTIIFLFIKKQTSHDLPFMIPTLNSAFWLNLVHLR